MHPKHFSSAVLIFVLSFLLTITANGLAAAGRRPFTSSIGNVSARHETDITPAGWTFSIWGLIYFWLSIAVLYIITFSARGSWARTLLPTGFFVSWFLNMLTNMTWLFVWDFEWMVASLVVLCLVSATNHSALIFCSYAIGKNYDWLKVHYPRDLACLGILVQNGLALYTTWTSIAILINFSIVLNLLGVTKSTAATVSLCILFAKLISWFVLENFVLRLSVNYIMTIYPVVILALAGNIAKHFDPAEPSANAVFMIVLLSAAIVMLVVRIIVVARTKTKPPPTTAVPDRQVMSSLLADAQNEVTS